MPATRAGDAATAAPVVVKVTVSSRPSTTGCTVSADIPTRAEPTPVGASVTPVLRVVAPAGPVTEATRVAAPRGSPVTAILAVPVRLSVALRSLPAMSSRSRPVNGRDVPVSSVTVTTVSTASSTPSR